MTFEERLAELGVDLSDLPQSDGCHLTYDRQSRSMAEQEVYRFAGMSGQLVDIIDCLKMHQDYILHLVDVIDRMETRIVNLTGELDWMIREMRDIGFCYTCYFHRFSTELTSPPECEACDPNRREDIMYRYCGVPEDWRADE